MSVPVYPPQKMQTFAELYILRDNNSEFECSPKGWLDLMPHSSKNSVRSIQTLLWVSTATWWPIQHGWSIPTLGQVCLFYMSSLASKCTRSTPTGQIGSILYDKNHKVALTFLFCMGKKKCKRSRQKMCTQLCAHTHTHNGLFILIQTEPLPTKSCLVCSCVGDMWMAPPGNMLFSCHAGYTHLALLLWGMMVHYWCTTLASLLSRFCFLPWLWDCCQSGNRNLRISIDSWWLYCLSTGLVVPLSSWKYLIKQSAAFLWCPDANK